MHRWEETMKLVTYQVEHKIQVGVISADGEWVYPISAIGPEYATMLEAVKQMSESEKQLLEYASKQEPYSSCSSLITDSCILSIKMSR